jgi:hypothetical protein
MSHTNGGLTRHHRKPRSLGGKSEKKNISRISAKKHTAWHILFRNLEPEAIADEINRMFLDPDYQLIVVRKS